MCLHEGDSARSAGPCARGPPSAPQLRAPGRARPPVPAAGCAPVQGCAPRGCGLWGGGRGGASPVWAGRAGAAGDAARGRGGRGGEGAAVRKRGGDPAALPAALRPAPRPRHPGLGAPHRRVSRPGAIGGDPRAWRPCQRQGPGRAAWAWGHVLYSGPTWSDFIRAGRRRFRRLRAGTRSCGPGPPVCDCRGGRGAPSHRLGRIHSYVRSCSATGTDREGSDWRI